MILVAGIPTEPPVEQALTELQELGAEVVVLNQRHFETMELAGSIDESGAIEGILRIGRLHYPLSAFSAAYVRLMDDRLLPELAGRPDVSPLRQQCSAFHLALTTWLDVAKARIVNRHGAMMSNGSKPYQAQQIVACGFQTPDTLVTNDPATARAFMDAHEGNVIYKSVSGARSIVQKISSDTLRRLDHIRICPVQFQALVRGTNVRVHVVGKEVYASKILSDAVDYRYAVQEVATPAEICPFELAPDLGERCVALAAALELEFAGIDLLLADDGQVYCFEVNPSPAYTYYEAHTRQPIAAALARLLCTPS